MATDKKNIDKSSIKNQKIDQSREKVFMSKAEADTGNKSSDKQRRGPSTGGYGDQHDPERTSDQQKDRLNNAGFGSWNENRSSDYDRGFRDGADHALKYSNQQNGSRGAQGNGDYNNSADANHSIGDVDKRSNRSFPSMQSGYGDSNLHLNDVKDEYDDDRNRRYGDDRGEDRPYKENEYGSPYKEERYEPNKYDRERNLRNESVRRERADQNRE